MEAEEAYIGARVCWNGREGYIIDTFTDNKGALMAVVSSTPSSTGVGNNVLVEKLSKVEV